MKLLHLSFHKGCINDLQYICDRLGYQCEVFSPNTEWNTNKTLPSLAEPDCQHYNITHERALKYWNTYKDYFDRFDCIVTSDTSPLSRIFLQNGWNKKLIIWICNRFDYAHGSDSGFPDKEYYDLIKKATTLPNVHLIGYTAFENIYAEMKGIDIGRRVIRPSGGISDVYNNHKHKYKPELKNTLFVPPYHNDTIMMNLKNQLEIMGLQAYTGRYDGPYDLTNYKAVVHIPYAWSNLAFF